MVKEYKYCPICGTLLKTGIVEGKERKYCPNCDFINYENPVPVAMAVAVRGKKLLLVKRKVAPAKGVWASPSGFIEIEESPEEACLRELEEEAGISGEIVKLIGVNRWEDREIGGERLMVKYLVKVGEGELTLGEEVEDAKFFDVTELPSYYFVRFKDVIKEIQSDRK